MLQAYMQKEDNVSVNSQDSTNTDSGRGSNEDAESRPSSLETDSRQYLTNQGNTFIWIPMSYPFSWYVISFSELSTA